MPSAAPGQLSTSEDGLFSGPSGNNLSLYTHYRGVCGKLRLLKVQSKIALRKDLDTDGEEKRPRKGHEKCEVRRGGGRKV